MDKDELRARRMDEVRAHAALWNDARETADREREGLILAVRAAIDSGVPELHLEHHAGLHRGTVRRWIGKPLSRGESALAAPLE